MVNTITSAIERAKELADKLLSQVFDLDLILLYEGLALGRGHSRSDYDMIAIYDDK